MDPEEASTRSESFFEIKTDLALVGNGTCGIYILSTKIDGLYMTHAKCVNLSFTHLACVIYRPSKITLT